MKYNFVLVAILFLLGTGCKKKDTTVKTQTVNLQVDAWTAGGSSGFQGGFLTGETAEVTLGPIATTFQVTYVQFLFGGSGSTPVSRDIVLTIYKDIGVGTPGALLFSNTYSIGASDNDLQQIDLRDQKIMVNAGGSIRVAIEMTAAGLPSVAVDKDGTINNSSNWVKTGGSWKTSTSLGFTGDFIIRAIVEKT